MICYDLLDLSPAFFLVSNLEYNENSIGDPSRRCQIPKTEFAFLLSFTIFDFRSQFCSSDHCAAIWIHSRSIRTRFCGTLWSKSNWRIWLLAGRRHSALQSTREGLICRSVEVGFFSQRMIHSHSLAVTFIFSSIFLSNYSILLLSSKFINY